MDENQQIKMSPDWNIAEERGNDGTDTRRRETGRALGRFAVSALRTESLAVVPEDIRIKFATFGGGEHLAIIRGTDSSGTPVVAFHSATSVTGVVYGAWQKFEQGTLKWQPDKYRL